MKKLGTIIIVLVILVVIPVLARNVIAQTAVVKGVKAIAGLDLEIRSINIGLFKTFLSLNDLKIFNPAGFQDRVMAEFPEIYVTYDLPGFISGKVHLEEVRVYLKELTVVKSGSDVNIKSLEAFAPKSKQEEKKEEGKAPEVQIDSLSLKIDKVIFKDYGQGGEPSVREFNVNIDENFKNITDPKALANLIVIKALSKTAIPNLANVDLSSVKQQVGEELAGQLEGAVGGFQEKASGMLKSIFK